MDISKNDLNTLIAETVSASVKRAVGEIKDELAATQAKGAAAYAKAKSQADAGNDLPVPADVPTDATDGMKKEAAVLAQAKRIAKAEDNAATIERLKAIDAAGSERAYLEQKAHKANMVDKAFRVIRLVAGCKGNTDAAAEIAGKMGDPESARYCKAMGAETMAGGGALVPSPLAAEVIEYLRPLSVVRSLGVTELPMPNGNLSIPKVVTGASGSWVGENANITKSELSMGEVVLREKTYAVLTPFSNKLLRYSSPKVDAVVRDDLSRELAYGMDVAMIRGAGTAYAPKGLYYQVTSGHSTSATCAGTTSTLAEISSDIGKAIRWVEEANIVIERGGHLFSPRSKWHLLTVQTTDGVFALRDEMLGGTLFTFPWRATNVIPSNLGGGTNESEYYFADFAKCIFGDGETLQIDAYDGGAYYDGSAVQSGISRDQTVIRAMVGMDFGVRHAGYEISVLTTVKWY